VQNDVDRRLVDERNETLVELEDVPFSHAHLLQGAAVTSADEDFVRVIRILNPLRFQKQKLRERCIGHVVPPVSFLCAIFEISEEGGLDVLSTL
jgi:hypothetical protein